MLDLQTPPRTDTDRPSAGGQPATAPSPPLTHHLASRGHVPATDGVLLHYRVWMPTTRTPIATLLFAHGIASHGGWFAGTAAFLADHGIAVYAPDRRGSGLSGGPRGHIPSYEQAITDLHTVLDLAAERHSASPIFLAGSSWAAKLAVATAAEAHGRLAGLLLHGPGLFPRVDVTPAQKAGVLLAHRLQPERRIPIPLVPGDYTRQAAGLAYITDDPYRLASASARFFWETRRLDRARDDYAGALALPVLLQMGGADRIMDTAATCQWLDRLPLSDRTVAVYRGAGHTLDFEPEPTVGAYRADLLDWLRRQAARRNAANTGGYGDGRVHS